MLRSSSPQPGSSRQERVAGLVGSEAAQWAVRGMQWFRWAAIGVLLTLVGICAEAATGQPWLWLIAAVGAACFAGGGVSGLIANQRAGLAASRYLSQKLSKPVVVKSGGVRVWVWEKEIAKAMNGLPRP